MTRAAVPEVRRAGPATRWEAVIALLRQSFAFMERRIDPPSSLTRMTAADLAEMAERGGALVAEAGGRPVACLFAEPEGDALSLSKIAVADAWRGKGLARALIHAAEAEARARGLAALVLQSRVELTETHAAFAALGFVPIGTTAHPGYDRPTSVTFRRALTVETVR